MNYTNFELYVGKESILQAESIDELKEKYVSLRVNSGNLLPIEQIDICDEDGGCEPYEDIEEFQQECDEEVEERLEIARQENEEKENLNSDYWGSR